MGNVKATTKNMSSYVSQILDSELPKCMHIPSSMCTSAYTPTQMQIQMQDKPLAMLYKIWEIKKKRQARLALILCKNT